MADAWDFNDDEDEEDLEDEAVNDDDNDDDDNNHQNGWEEEDDLEVEDDDQPVETLPAPTVRVGGFVLGRLSQFLEAVTQPEPPPMPLSKTATATATVTTSPSIQQQQHQQTPAMPRPNNVTSVVEPQNLSHAAPFSNTTPTPLVNDEHDEELEPDLMEEEVGDENGWGDDDLELDHTEPGEDEDENPMAPTNQMNAVDDDHQHDHADMKEPVDGVGETIRANSWDEDDNILEEALEEEEHVTLDQETSHAERQQQQQPPPPTSIVDPTSTTSEPTSQATAGTASTFTFLGWLGAKKPADTQAAAKSNNDNADESQRLDDDDEPVITQQPPSSGWEEDDNALEDALGDDDVDHDDNFNDDELHNTIDASSPQVATETTTETTPNAVADPEDQDHLDDVDLNSAPPTGNNPLVEYDIPPTDDVDAPETQGTAVGWDDANIDDGDFDNEVLNNENDNPEQDEDDDDDDVLKETSGSSRVIVDHVPLPSERLPYPSATNSALSAFTTSSLYEGQDFGLVVDHTPLQDEDVTSDYKMDRSESIRVVVPKGAVDEEEEEEEEFDDDDNANTTLPEKSSQVGTADFAETGTSAWEDEDDELDDALAEQQGEGVVVDHTPSEHVGRLLYADSTISIAATSLEDEKQDYGLVVDHTPREILSAPPTDSSFAAHTDVSMFVLMTEQECLEQEDEEDGGITVGDSRIEVTPPVAENEQNEAVAAAAEDGWNEELLNEEALETGIVDHLPSEQAMVRVSTATSDAAMLATASTMSAATTSACDDEEKDDETDYGPVVDHLPQRQKDLQRMRSLDTGNISTVQSQSLAPSLDNPSETADEDDDRGATNTNFAGHYLSEQNLNDTASARAMAKPGAAVSFASSTRGGSSSGGDDDYSLVVDHTPTDEPSLPTVDASVAVLATAEEIEEEEADDGSNVEDDHFGPVVDHTPSISPHPASRASSMMVIPPNDDDDDMDVTNTTGDFGAGSTLDGWEEPEFENLASVSEDGPLILNAIGEGQPLQDDSRVVVDHVPRQQQRPDSRAAEASTCVLADPSEVLSHLDDGLGQQEDLFGPVVDLTPPSRSTISPSAAGSTAVNAPPSEVPDDLDDENFTEQADGEGWDHDTVEDETPNPQSAIDEDANKPREQMVDFLPPEPNELANNEIVSTMATGGAQSVVQPDDAREDEFGPVVDHTPRSPHAVSASVLSTSSMVAPSECERLLQDDVESETATRVSDNIGLQDENVVDHLPPPKLYPRADSTAAVQSHVSSEEDYVESGSEDDEDFVPVVDHLPPKSPFPPSRGGSTIDALATVSEVVEDLSDEEDDDVDVGGWNEDEVDVADEDLGSSLHTNETSSPSTEDRARRKDSTPYQNEVFRTVDHRVHIPPAASSDATVMTSNGGNMDEVQYFDLQNDDLNITALKHNEETVYHDALGGDSTHTGGNDTQFYDPEIGEASNWDDGVLFEENQEDDGGIALSVATGQPSDDRTDQSVEHDMPTAQRRDSNEMTPKKGNRPLVAVDGTQAINLDCKACAEATTADCPCIRQILALNGQNGGMVGAVVTPEGNRVRVDFSKLLQTEITRRLLVEKECEALKSTVESLKLSLTAAQTSMALQALARKSSNEAAENLEAVRQRCAALEADNESLKLTAAEKDKLIAEFQSQEQSLSSVQDSHLCEVKLLKERIDEISQLKEVTKSAYDDQCAQNKKLLNELDAARTQVAGTDSLRSTFTTESTVKALSTEIDSLKQDAEVLKQKNSLVSSTCDELRGQNESLKNELSLTAKQLSELDAQRGATLARESAADTQNQHLNDSLQQITSASSVESNLQVQLVRVQEDLTSKVTEIEELQSQLSEVRRRLQASDVLSFNQTKEIARLSKHHEQEVEKLRVQLRSLQQAEQEARAAKDKSEKELSLRTSVLEIENRKQKIEIDKLLKELNAVRVLLEQESKQNGAIIQHNRMELDSLKSNMRRLEQEKHDLQKRLSDLQSTARLSQLASFELEVARKEKSTLQEELKETKTMIDSLRNRLAETDSGDVKESDLIQSLRRERDELLEAIQDSRSESQRSIEELAKVKEEQRIACLRLEEAQSKYQNLEASTEAIKLSAIKAEAKIRDANSKLVTLRCELEQAISERDIVSVHRQQLESRCDELDAELERMRRHQSSRSESAGVVEISKIQAELSSLQAENAKIESDREVLRIRCKDLDTRLAAMLASTSQRSVSTASEVESEQLRGQLHDQQLLLDQQSKQIQELEARLSILRDDLAAKEATVTELQEQHSTIRAHAQEVVDENDCLSTKVDDLENELLQRREDAEKYEAELKDKHDIEIKLREDLNLLVSEREMVLRERDMLEEDNEEMLVQFGLLKQEMDASNDQLKALREQLTAKEQEAKSLENRLQETLSKLSQSESVLTNGVHHGVSGADMQEKVDELSDEVGELQEQVQKLSLLLKDKETQVASVNAERTGLLARVRAAEAQLKILEGQEHMTASAMQRSEERCRDLESQLNNTTEAFARSKSELQQQIQSLKSQDESKKAALNRLEERCRQLEKQLNDSAAAYAHEQADIQNHIHSLKSQLSEKDSQLQALALDNAELRRHLQEKDTKKATSGGEALEREHIATLKRLGERYSELEKSSRELQMENQKLKEVLRNTQSVAEQRLQQKERQRITLEQEKASQLDRIAFLEQACTSRDETITKKTSAIADLQQRLHQASDASPAGNIAVEELRKNIRRLEHDKQQQADQMKELESLLLQTKQQLRETSAKLADAESSQLSQNNNQNQEAATAIEKRLETTKSRLKEKTKEAMEFKKNAFLLSKQVTSLQAEVQTLKDQLASLEASQSRPQPNQESSAASVALIQQVKALQEQLKTMASEHRAKDEKLRSEFNALYGAMTKKSDLVVDMESQLQSLSSELATCREGLLAKEEDIRRLTYDIEAQNSKDLQSTVATTARILESTHEDAETLEKMRSHIIALGQALERSESQRAEALDRLMKERLANAQSLKHMTESVKRFYWSMSAGGDS